MSGGTGTGYRVVVVPDAPDIGVFKTQLAEDLAGVFFNTDEFAESVVYTSAIGAASTVNVILSAEDLSGKSPVAPGDTMIILAKYADIALPGRGDTFTIDSEIWHFVENIGGGRAEGVWHIRVSRSARRVVSERAFL